MKLKKLIAIALTTAALTSSISAMSLTSSAYTYCDSRSVTNCSSYFGDNGLNAWVTKANAPVYATVEGVYGQVMTLKPQYQRCLFRNNARTLTQGSGQGRTTWSLVRSYDSSGEVVERECTMTSANAQTDPLKVYQDYGFFFGSVSWT